MDEDTAMELIGGQQKRIAHMEIAIGKLRERNAELQTLVELGDFVRHLESTQTGSLEERIKELESEKKGREDYIDLLRAQVATLRDILWMCHSENPAEKEKGEDKWELLQTMMGVL